MSESHLPARVPMTGRLAEPTRDLDGLVRTFAHTLERSGLHAALAWLNARTRYRFTGVYRFDGAALRNVALFDRENPGIHLGNDAVLRETYCGLVASARAPFETADGRRDRRVGTLPARETTLAYCGVPVMTADAGCAGTLCHFDPRPRLLAAAEVPLLERCAALLAPALAAARRAAVPA